MTCSPTIAATPAFAQDRAFITSGAELSMSALRSWSNDVATLRADIDRVRVVPTSVHAVDGYRPTNAAALAKQGAPPRGEPR